MSKPGEIPPYHQWQRDGSQKGRCRLEIFNGNEAPPQLLLVAKFGLTSELLPFVAAIPGLVH